MRTVEHLDECVEKAGVEHETRDALVGRQCAQQAHHLEQLVVRTIGRRSRRRRSRRTRAAARPRRGRLPLVRLRERRGGRAGGRGGGERRREFARDPVEQRELLHHRHVVELTQFQVRQDA